MTLFSEKTENAIIEDMKEIQNDAREIVKLCNKCLRLVKRKDAGNIDSWTPDWAEVTTEIRDRYENMILSWNKRGADGKVPKVWFYSYTKVALSCVC